MLDFPSSPTVGQVFGTWAWDGTKWTQGNAPVPPAVVSSFNTRTGSVVFQQADATAVGILNDVGRNLIHNPMFTVQQRGQGPWTTNGVYTADRWVQFSGPDTINTVCNAMDDTIRAQIGDEMANSTLYTTFTGSAAAGGFVIIQQYIEGVRRLAGRTVTLSFWAATNGAALRIGVSLDQYFGTGGSPSAFVSVAAQTITATATWTRYSLTYVMPSVAGKTFGSNNNESTNLLFWYSSGSTYATRAGNPGVQSGGIALWGVQLEYGSAVTPLAKRDVQQEGALCLRYYVGSLLAFSSAYQAANATAVAVCFLPVQMRAAPTFGVFGDYSTNVGARTLTMFNANTIYAQATVTALGGTILNVQFSASADL